MLTTTIATDNHDGWLPTDTVTTIMVPIRLDNVVTLTASLASYLRHVDHDGATITTTALTVRVLGDRDDVSPERSDLLAELADMVADAGGIATAAPVVIDGPWKAEA